MLSGVVPGRVTEWNRRWGKDERAGKESLDGVEVAREMEMAAGFVGATWRSLVRRARPRLKAVSAVNDGKIRDDSCAWIAASWKYLLLVSIRGCRLVEG